MIQVNHVVKKFDNFCALNDTTLHVKKGAIYGLVGPNGAGKSTVIRTITGIYKPNQGEVLIAGEPVFENPSAKEKFAYIPDDMFYFQQANVLDMKRFYRGLYKNFDNNLFLKLRDAFPNIDPKANIRRLSKGMQKQVAFWLTISCRPEILILDEPVDGLDPVMRRQIWSIILSDVTEYGTTVLVSSHNLRELEDVCDHVGIMHHGRVMVERSLSELQGSVCKIQVAFQEGMPKLPESFEVLHMSSTGRVYTLIVKGDQEEAKAQLSKMNPMLIDVLPLSLEEIFIYELGGEDYAVKDILF
ncbi:MAG: ABC transporter ATP-binding protein [Lachnospiraceae bacterium]|nr:ABC transporter ATP-binding protein [Lachnospiraceae bacterium]